MVSSSIDGLSVNVGGRLDIHVCPLKGGSYPQSIHRLPIGGVTIVNLSVMNPIDPSYLSFRYGQNHFQHGDYDRAIASFSKAIEFMPNFVSAYQHRGHAYLAKSDNVRAARDFYTAETCRKKLSQ